MENIECCGYEFVDCDEDLVCICDPGDDGACLLAIAKCDIPNFVAALLAFIED